MIRVPKFGRHPQLVPRAVLGIKRVLDPGTDLGLVAVVARTVKVAVSPLNCLQGEGEGGEEDEGGGRGGGTRGSKKPIN